MRACHQRCSRYSPRMYGEMATLAVTARWPFETSTQPVSRAYQGPRSSVRIRRGPSHRLQQGRGHVHDLSEVWPLEGVLLPALDHEVAPRAAFRRKKKKRRRFVQEVGGIHWSGAQTSDTVRGGMRKYSTQLMLAGVGISKQSAERTQNRLQARLSTLSAREKIEG